jgi:proline racemase
VQLAKTLTAVEVHAEGEQGTCYIGSVFDVPGATMREKLHYLNEVDDSLRRFVTLEPRGRPQASANLVFPSSHPDAHAGFVICQSDRTHAMSGSNTICVVTALLETGTIPMVEPETEVVLETAAGLIRARAECHNGRCERVTFDGVPSFVETLDVSLDVAGFGIVNVDVAYGGCYYVLVQATELGVSLDRASARAIVNAATPLMAAAREQISVKHPEVPEIDFLSYVMVVGDDERGPRGATVLSGRVDRSPCGTGNAARLAVMAARGDTHVGSSYTASSIIDSEFVVTHLADTTVAGRAAVVPQISGRGWVTGTRITAVDPTDPYPLGFTLTDVWGD